MKKILIIGSHGMAGHVILHHLREKSKYDVIDIARSNKPFSPKLLMDVTNFDRLANEITTHNPDVIINCIGVLNKDAEDNPAKSILLNSYLPHFIAKVGNEIGSKLIHISTDCVFSGKMGGYTEDSFKDGIGYYAQSKALGEVTYGNNLTIRTSIVGPEIKDDGIGLFHWFMGQNGAVKGYSKAFWTGITTIELAKVIDAAISSDISGLHHLVNDQKISKFELLNLFKDVFNRDGVSIDNFYDYSVDKSLVRTNYAFEYIVPPYLQMVREMKKWMEDHHFLYSYNIR